MECPADRELSIACEADVPKTWRHYARQALTFVMCWICPPYGFYLLNKNVAAIEARLDEADETADDMIAMLLEKSRP